jgi:hypothetical protein
MENLCLQEEAEICRRKAVRYVGQPEASFLLRVASEFDRLADEGAILFLRDGEKRRLR